MYRVYFLDSLVIGFSTYSRPLILSLKPISSTLFPSLPQLKYFFSSIDFFKHSIPVIYYFLFNTRKKKPTLSIDNKVIKKQTLYYSNPSLLFKLWSLHLLNYNHLINIFKTNQVNIKIKSPMSSTFLQKLYTEFSWVKKYLPPYLSKKKIIFSWLLFLVTKETQFIVKIIFTLISINTFKKHRYILIKIKRLLNFFSIFLKTHFIVNSVFFSIKGKVGVKGSAKKKKFKYRGGKGIPNSQKNLKMNKSSFLIYTNTGVMGCDLKITY